MTTFNLVTKTTKKAILQLNGLTQYATVKDNRMYVSEKVGKDIAPVLKEYGVWHDMTSNKTIIFGGEDLTFDMIAGIIIIYKNETTYELK